MKIFAYITFILLISQVAFAQQTISSLAELIALQDASNQNIKMAPGTYHFSSSSKSLFPGENWRVAVEGNWPGLLKFTGNNNTFDLTGVTLTFDSTILLEMPSIVHGRLVELGGSGNVWKGFNLQEIPNSFGEYGAYAHTSGGVILVITGDNHQFYDLTLKPRFSRPYGFGSLYGKTGSSSGSLPGSRLSKKTGLFIIDLKDSYFKNTLIDHSGFGHTLAFNGDIDDVIFDTVAIIAETRSTDDLYANGVAGTDRNGVPFNVLYNGEAIIGTAGQSDFLNLFDASNLNQCQELGAGRQSSPIQKGYQYSLSEDSFRGYYNGQVGRIEIYNATVVGSRAGIALEYAAEGMIVNNMTVRGIAGHGVPACGGWNGDNGGEGDASAYGPPSHSVLKNTRADAAYATILELSGDRTNITADIEVLDPTNGYHRPAASTALALISGDDHDIRIWKRDNQALQKDLVIKVSDAENLLLCNMTQQDVSIASNVTNSTIYSVGSINNSSASSANNTVVKLSNAANEPDICSALASASNATPAPSPTPTPGDYVSMRKSNSMAFAIDGNHGGADAQNVYLWLFDSNNENQHWEEISRGEDYYSYKKRGTNFCLDGNHGGEDGQNVYLWTCSTNNHNQHWKKINVNGQYRLEKRNAPGYSLDGNHGGEDTQNLYLWQSSNTNANQLWEFSSH